MSCVETNSQRGNVETTDCIRVIGARTHNLRNVSLDIPRDKLVVITGVSGSGKSSLAFDTLFAEGQRRYLDCVSSHARKVLDQLERPDVDEIEGLPPTIALDQHAGSVQPRSTLATVTEIHDHLRLLFARAGQPHCPQCGTAVSKQSPQAIVERILALEAGRKVMILAPVVRGRKGTHCELIEKIGRDGFVRARVDGEIVDVATPPELKKSKAHDIEIVIDRIVVKEGLRARLQESVDLSLRHGDGNCVVSYQDGDVWRDDLFSSRFACPSCGHSFAEVEPRTFSFNSPYGACQECEGLGVVDGGSWIVDRDADEKRRVEQGPRSTIDDPRGNTCPMCAGTRLGAVGRAVTVGGLAIHEVTALTVVDAAALVQEWEKSLAGAEPTAHLPNSPCLPVSVSPPLQLTPAGRLVAEKLLPELATRLDFLSKVGLDYLTLDRPTVTLSGGELQRSRLAECLGAGLIGVCYVLDEPTVGLHPRDTHRLLDALRALRDQGASVIVVEHDPDVIRAADHVVELGPSAGSEGGCIVTQGTPEEISQEPESPLGRYLHVRNHRHLDSPGRDCEREPRPHQLTLSEATTHNLQHVTIDIPLGRLTCVTGVSGSGKSSLVMETLVPAVRSMLANRRFDPRATVLPTPSGSGAGGEGTPRRTLLQSEPLNRSTPPHPGPLPEGEGAVNRVLGVEHIDRLVEIDQAPIGRSGRSNPATVSGLWDEVRRLFAATRDAKLRGYRSSRFSFNAKGGRCDVCRGHGTRRVALGFLPDLHVVCPACRGSRFNRQTLQVKFRGKSVADLLAMRIDEATEVFRNFSRLHGTLQTFVSVGLGYLTLGQSSRTLSGGEAQRVKLASELSRVDALGRTLFVLDEPTTGLHPLDVARLLDLLQRLVEQEHTVLVIEHNLDVIAAADWVIDLGPEAGAAGGRIVASGPAERIAECDASHTGRALRAYFDG